jgi:hypothetical protein
MSKTLPGHFSRSKKSTTMRRKPNVRNTIKKRPSMSKKQIQRKIKDTISDIELSKKISQQIKLDSNKIVTPGISHINKFLNKARKKMRKKKYSEAFLYTLAASAVAAAQGPLHENVTLDSGTLGNSMGFMSNPDTLVKWHSKHAYPLSKMNVKFTRKQRRRRERLTRKNKI